MAEYAARLVEMDKEVEALHEQALKVERGGGPAAVRATYVRLSAGVTAYGKLRDTAFTKALEDSTGLLKPAAGATGETHKNLWTEHFKTYWSNQGFRILSDLVAREGDPIQWKFELMTMQESASYIGLTCVGIAEALGEIRAHTRSLEEAREKRRAEWRELGNMDDRQDGQMILVRLRVLEDFKQAVSKIRGWAPKFEEAIRKMLTFWKTGEDYDPEPSPAEGLSNVATALGTLQRTLDEATRQTQPLYAAQQTVHQMFANTRLQLKEYLEKVNKDTIAKRWIDACRAQQEAIAKCVTPGQRDDGKRFLERVIAGSQGIIGEFNSAWNSFYTEFDGIFVGPVSARTVAILAEEEFFNQFFRDVESLDLPGAIRATGEALARIRNTSLDQMSEEQIRQWNEVILVRIKELEEKIRSQDMSVVERSKLLIVVSFLLLKDKLTDLAGYGK